MDSYIQQALVISKVNNLCYCAIATLQACGSGSSHPKMGSIGHKLMELCLASWQALPWSTSLNLHPEPIRGSSFKLSAPISHPCSVKSRAAVGSYSRESITPDKPFYEHGRWIGCRKERCDRLRGKSNIISILLLYTQTTTWKPGTNPPSFDKQPVRDWLAGSGWDRSSPPPELPPEIDLKNLGGQESELLTLFSP